METLPDILKEAIAIEIYGKEYYSIFSEIVDDEKVKAVFRRLAGDEEEHRKILEKEYVKIKGKPAESGIIGEENRERARRIFPESLGAMGIDETKDVLRLGIRTEERSIELYSKGAEKTDVVSIKVMFLKLVHFEEEHRKTLTDALYYLEQEGTWEGYSLTRG